MTTNQKLREGHWRLIKTHDKSQLSEFVKSISQGYSCRSAVPPFILTRSKAFQSKIEFVDLHKGSRNEVGLLIYRYDSRDEQDGRPINVDMYCFTENGILKLDPPFRGHHLKSLPSFTEMMKISCSCGESFSPNVKENEIPVFNKVKRHSYYHIACPNCGKRIDIAKIRHGRYMAISG